MEKIIFLDIDGVLCHNGFLKSDGNMVRETIHLDSNHNELFYGEAIKNLKLILEHHPDVKIFLMSSWGVKFDTFQFNQLLVERGLPPICIDVMRDKVGYNRGDKLSKWMKMNYGESYDYTLDKPELINTNISYVILDDSYLSDYQYKQKDHIVEVATYKCLTYENALQAIEILNKEAKNW